MAIYGRIWPYIGPCTLYLVYWTLYLGGREAVGTLDTGYLPGYHKEYTLHLGTPSQIDRSPVR